MKIAKVEKFVSYWTNHSPSIIQWLVLATMALISYLVARSLFAKKEALAAGPVVAGPSPELQSVLDKIMAQTAKLEGVSLQTMNPAGLADMEIQVQALKKDLAAREDEINQLKAAGPSKAGEDAAQLSSRIKELEAKLSEYEILEDDIADLSLYKEENARLKAELESARSASGSLPQPPPAFQAAPNAAAPENGLPSVQPSDAIVNEFAQAVSQDPVLSAPADGVSIEIPDTGNPMADFESAVQLERKLTGAAPTASKPAPALEITSAQTAPQATSAAEQTPPAESDDLFAEFSQSAPVSSEEASTLDTSKMMEEMAALVNLEPMNGSALDEGIDMDKMAAEAGKKA